MDKNYNEEEDKIKIDNEAALSEDVFFSKLTGDRKLAADTPELVEGEDEENSEIAYYEVQDYEENEEEAEDPLDKTTTFIELRELVQNVGLNYYVTSKIEIVDKYSYSASQKNALIKAWKPIIARSSINVGPWTQIIIAEVFANAPLVALAREARKQRKKVEQLQKQIERMRNSQDIEEIEVEPTREDKKGHWLIDKNYYFTHDLGGNYIKIEDRKEKADITDKYQYKMLRKYKQIDENGKTI